MDRELLGHYGMLPLEEFKAGFDDRDTNERGIVLEWSRDLLHRTDHIPNKIIEAQALGNDAEDYTEILRYRQFARDEINRLEAR